MSYETWNDAILLVPEHMRAGVIRYIQYGVPGGDFQTSVFQNDLVRSAQYADHINKHSLPAWAEFLLYCRARCYGTAGKVAAWEALGGIDGINRIASTEPAETK